MATTTSDVGGGLQRKEQRATNVYLTLAPRGLHNLVCQALVDRLSTTNSNPNGSPRAALSIKAEIVGETIALSSSSSSLSNVADTSNTQETPAFVNELSKLVQASHDKKQQGDDISISPYFRSPVGSVELDSSKCPPSLSLHHVSLGYQKDEHPKQTPIWSYPGEKETVWIRFDTDAPPHIIRQQCRFLGPLLALVQVYDNIHLTESQDLEQAKTYIANNLLQQHDYPFLDALKLWQKHVFQSWNLSPPQQEQLNQKLSGKSSLRYRLSCLRTVIPSKTHTSANHDKTVTTMGESKKKRKSKNSKKSGFLYSRQQLLAQLADIIVPPSSQLLLPPLTTSTSSEFLSTTAASTINSTSSSPTTTTTTTSSSLSSLVSDWKVDMKRYDLEVTLLIRPNCLIVGLTLAPYQHLNTRSFASGNIPPDVHHPVLPSTNTNGLVRLRPSTAQLLLHLADIQPGDIVLDPCAGIGTIPMEAFLASKKAFGIGGDLVLTPSTLGPIAVEYAQKVHNKGADLLAWDACSLPLQTESVDVIVSDLPFGQQCLSTTKLESILPLLLAEMARVLRRKSGRMVLLCGAYQPIIRAMAKLEEHCQKKKNSNTGHNGKYFAIPCLSLFPVTIGGLLAWIVHVQRGTKSIVAREVIPNHLQRLRKLTYNRNQNERKRQSDLDSGRMSGKKRTHFQA